MDYAEADEFDRFFELYRIRRDLEKQIAQVDELLDDPFKAGSDEFLKIYCEASDATKRGRGRPASQKISHRNDLWISAAKALRKKYPSKKLHEIVDIIHDDIRDLILPGGRIRRALNPTGKSHSTIQNIISPHL
ncbi:MAG: hypothetical protein H7836_06460 [Magnetococcus sp. YQC-3]